jgi:branched-chain amino acid transport system ATP-binding protein
LKRDVASRTPSDLSVRGISVTYGRNQVAVHNVDLSVPAGRIVGVLGANGAGKTTILRAITGFLRSEHAAVTSGQIKYGAESLKGRPPHWIAQRGISMVPERNKIFSSLTVEENLEIGAATVPTRAERKELHARIFDYFPPLHRRIGTKGGFLSGGERQMLGIARSLMARPSLLLVDELSMGLAPKTVHDLMQVLHRINTEQGTSILFVEQTAVDALDLAQFVYIIESGTLALQGDSDVIRGRQDVQEVYLGIRGDELAAFGSERLTTKARRWSA